MFANVRPVGRESRMTPSCVATAAGRLHRPPKSPLLATLAPRCSGTGRARESRKVRRDVLTKGIPMYTPKMETARSCSGRAADEAVEAGNLKVNDTQPASKLFAEADQVIETLPFIVTRKGKHNAKSQVLRLFLAALAAGREEMAA